MLNICWSNVLFDIFESCVPFLPWTHDTDLHFLIVSVSVVHIKFVPLVFGIALRTFGTCIMYALL